jgi:anti-anti-sigma regulatory factor
MPVVTTLDVVADVASATLTLRGEFVHDDVAAFRAALSSLDGRCRTVILDLTDLDRVDSFGIEELVRARIRLPRIVLRSPQPDLLRQLHDAHLAGVFDLIGVVPTAELAI